MKLSGYASACVFLCLLGCASHAAGRPQDSGFSGQIPNLGEIRGMTSFRSLNTGGAYGVQSSYLAVWYYNARPQQRPSSETILVIFEPQPGGYKEVFRYVEKPPDDLMWSDITALDTGSLVGVVVKVSGESDYSVAKVVALVRGKFKIVFEGETSEFFDLNADGYPEIFESGWPDGDGYPAQTTVHVWDGVSYRPLLKTKFARRFDSAVQRAVGRAARRLNTAVGFR